MDSQEMVTRVTDAEQMTAVAMEECNAARCLLSEVARVLNPHPDETIVNAARRHVDALDAANRALAEWRGRFDTVRFAVQAAAEHAVHTYGVRLPCIHCGRMETDAEVAERKRFEHMTAIAGPDTFTCPSCSGGTA